MMNEIITRDTAWQLLTEFTQSESLRKHAMAVEACMRACSGKFGNGSPDDENLWGIVGLIHDYKDVKEAISGMGPHASLSENLMGGGVLTLEAAKYGALALVPEEGEAETAIVESASERSAVVESATARGRANEAKLLEDMGMTKNTQKVSTGNGKSSIPDAMDSKRIVEIKDTKVVSNTRQLQTQRQVAHATNREHVVVTGAKTHVTTPAGQSTIVRRTDIGPQ